MVSVFIFTNKYEFVTNILKTLLLLDLRKYLNLFHKIFEEIYSVILVHRHKLNERNDYGI